MDKNHETLPRMGDTGGGAGVSVDGSGSSCSIEESQQKVKKLVLKSWKIQLIIPQVNLPWFVSVLKNLESPGI